MKKKYLYEKKILDYKIKYYIFKLIIYVML